MRTDEPFAHKICYTLVHPTHFLIMSHKIVKLLFDNNSPLPEAFVKWFSNQGEQLFADYQISEGLVKEDNDPNMPNFDHNNNDYVDFRKATDSSGFPLRYPNNDSIFDSLEGDDLIHAMSVGEVEQAEE